MKTFNKLNMMIGLSFLVAGFANAGNHQHYIDSARVIKSKPIYETVKVEIPEKQCRGQRHGRRHGHHEYSQNSYTPTITGAVIGGIVGNQFGRGNGNKAMTIAGTVLGGSIGNDVGSHRSARHSGKHRCKTVMRYESREEIVGYKVKYRYNGKKFWTRTQYEPGSTIRIKVSVQPIVEQNYSANVRHDSNNY